MVKKLNLNAIRIDGGTQSRVEISEPLVARYCEAIEAGDTLPPVVVFFDGADSWLADGFHRWHAHRKLGKASIAADVRDGTRREAVLHSYGANGRHGQPPSNADKRKIAEAMLRDEEWGKWSDNKIAKLCGFSQSFVGDVRRAILSPTEDAPPAARTVERAGKTYKQDTGNIGKSNPYTRQAEATEKPPAAPAPSGPPATTTADDAFSDMDPVKELEKAYAENARLTAEIEAAEADDLKAEAIKWRRSCEHAQRQQSEAMDRAKQAVDREAWTMKMLRRCGKAVGVDDPKKIAVAVEAMAREAKGVAA